MAASKIAITRNKTQQTTNRATTHRDASNRESEHNNGFVGPLGPSTSFDPFFLRVWFRNALDALQERPIAKARILLIVFHLVAPSIGSMASDLQNGPEVDGY